MEISEAKSYRDCAAHVTWTDRLGAPVSKTLHVFEVAFVPLYGPCLVTTEGEIRLDRVLSVELSAARAA